MSDREDSEAIALGDGLVACLAGGVPARVVVPAAATGRVTLDEVCARVERACAVWVAATTAADGDDGDVVVTLHLHAAGPTHAFGYDDPRGHRRVVFVRVDGGAAYDQPGWVRCAQPAWLAGDDGWAATAHGPRHIAGRVRVYTAADWRQKMRAERKEAAR